jgi:hypothetical protein
MGWCILVKSSPIGPVDKPKRSPAPYAAVFDHYLMNAPAPVWMTVGVPAIEKGKTQGFELEE